MLIGILWGLATAGIQAFCYLLARHYLTRYGSPRQLLFVSQLFLGIFSLCGVGILLPGELLKQWQLYPAWLLCSGGYLVGQFTFFAAQRKIESSRLASLYSVKMIVVAIFSAWIIGEALNPGRWLGILLAVAAVFIINYSRQSGFDCRGLGVLAVAIVGFALSDIGAKLLLDRERALGMSFVAAGMLTVSLNFLLAAVLLLSAIGKHLPPWHGFRPALPYAVCWYAGVMGTFVCMGILGATFGNVVQSSRGIIALLLGILVARLGYGHLESRATRQVWIQRSVGAGLMCGAIALFALNS